MIARVERVAPLPLLVDLDPVLRGLGMEEGSIVGGSEGLEVFAERWAHLVEDLIRSSDNSKSRDGRLEYIRLKCWPTWYHRPTLAER